MDYGGDEEAANRRNDRKRDDAAFALRMKQNPIVPETPTDLLTPEQKEAEARGKKASTEGVRLVKGTLDKFMDEVVREYHRQNPGDVKLDIVGMAKKRDNVLTLDTLYPEHRGVAHGGRRGSVPVGCEYTVDFKVTAEGSSDPIEFQAGLGLDYYWEGIVRFSYLKKGSAWLVSLPSGGVPTPTSVKHPTWQQGARLVVEAVEKEIAKSNAKTAKAKDTIVQRDPNAKALKEKGSTGQGSHKNKQDFDRGHARQPKHKKDWHDKEASSDSVANVVTAYLLTSTTF